MLNSSWKPDVRIQFNGNACYLVGTRANIQAAQDWLYNIGACDATADDLESMGDGNYFFTVSRSKLVRGLAQHWQHDIEDSLRIKPFRGTRADLTAKALRLATSRATAWLASLPHASARLTRAMFVDWFTVSMQCEVSRD